MAEFVMYRLGHSSMPPFLVSRLAMARDAGASHSAERIQKQIVDGYKASEAYGEDVLSLLRSTDKIRFAWDENDNLNILLTSGEVDGRNEAHHW